jgi:hypothetical protein
VDPPPYKNLTGQASVELQNLTTLGDDDKGKRWFLESSNGIFGFNGNVDTDWSLPQPLRAE